MNVGGTVIAVALEMDAKYAKKPGTYKAWQLIYKDMNGQVKEITKSVSGLKFNEPLRDSLASLAPGDEITIVQEKDGQFWEIKSIEKGMNNVTAPAPKPSYTGGKVTGSNYETADERAARQRLIVRQSSITAALALFDKKKVDDLDEVLAVADRITNWVFEKE